MQKRSKMKTRNSKKLFRNTQDLTHKFNTNAPVIKRGGIRM